jgi:hypothetical protein
MVITCNERAAAHSFGSSTSKQNQKKTEKNREKTLHNKGPRRRRRRRWEIEMWEGIRTVHVNTFFFFFFSISFVKDVDLSPSSFLSLCLCFVILFLFQVEWGYYAGHPPEMSKLIRWWAPAVSRQQQTKKKIKKKSYTHTSYIYYTILLLLLPKMYFYAYRNKTKKNTQTPGNERWHQHDSPCATQTITALSNVPCFFFFPFFLKTENVYLCFTRIFISFSGPSLQRGQE